jgi:predicted dehydrogenase
VETAEQAGVPLSVYQNRRWDSDLLTVRRLIETGELGDVTRFESRFERFAPDPGPPAAGGGTLLDFGSHLVDQALLLFGPVSRVYAELRARHELDDDVFVALHHDGGVESHLYGSWVQGAPGPRFRVTGTTGTYLVADVDGQEDALLAGRTPAGEGDRWGVEPEHRWGSLHRGGAGTPVPSERGRWDLFYSAFATAVRGDGRVPVDPWDSVRALEILDAARDSATGGHSVDLRLP